MSHAKLKISSFLFAIMTCLYSKGDDGLRQQAMQELQNALHSQTSLVQLHAAESLLKMSFSENVINVFKSELMRCEQKPSTCIGIWRVLAQAATDKSERDQYLNRIREVYLKCNGDQEMAAESLAKLQYVIPPSDRPLFIALAQDSQAEGVVCRRWLVTASGDANDVRWLAQLLDSSDVAKRGITAYALRFLAGKLPPDVSERLVKVATNEPSSKYRIYFLTAAYIAATDREVSEKFKKELLPFSRSTNTQDRYEVAAALAARGSKSDIPLLTELLNDQDPDVRVSAANAILQIDR